MRWCVAHVAAYRIQLGDLTLLIDSIYHIPLQAPLTTIREIKARAILLDSVMQGVAIKHPLVSR